MIKSILFTLLLLSCFIYSGTVVQAKDLFGSKVCTTSTTSSAVCTDKNHVSARQDPLSGNRGLLRKITDIIAFLAGAIAVIMIIVGALRFVTSGSDISTGSRTDTDVEEARHTIANALIGLAVIVLARALILFVLNKV